MKAPRWLREWWALLGVPPMTSGWVRALADSGAYLLSAEREERRGRGTPP